MLDKYSGGITDSVKWAFAQYSRARQAIARVYVPTLDLLPDGGIALENVTVATGATSTGQPIQFIEDGYLVGVTCSVQSGTAADLSSTKLALSINGSTDIITAGQQGRAFATFAQLSGSSQDGRTFRLMVPVKASIPYQAYIKYVGTNETVTADMTFWYVGTVTPPLTS